MPDPAFFQSESRLLAASPSGDFGLYGAQPTFQTIVGTPADDAANAPSQDGAASGTSLPTAVQTSLFEAQSTARVGLADDSAQHGGSLAPAAFAPSAPDAGPNAAATPLNPFDLRPITLTSLEGQGDGGHAPGATPANAFAAPTLDNVPFPLGGAIGTLVGSSQPLTESIQVITGDTVNTMVGLIEPAAGDAVDGVTSLAGGPLDGVAAAADDVAPSLLATLGEAGQFSGDIADDVPVTDLLGSDPAGGIATLVDLVNVADLLDLRDAAAPGDGAGADLTDPVGGLLDTLTVDVTDITHQDGDDADQDSNVMPTHDPLGGVLGGNQDPDLGLGG